MLVLRAYYFVHDGLFGLLKHLTFTAPLLMRLYLAPVMIAAGLSKLHHLPETAQWFGQGLGLPEPLLMAQLVVAIELVGGFCLLFGLALLWVCIPLMITMAVAAATVHWSNGWFAIAPSDPLSSTAKPLADVGIAAARDSLENSLEVGRRLARAQDILRDYGHYDWLTAKGQFVVLNNGIEFAATYFIMLLALMFTGAGRWVSFDYYLDRHCRASMARDKVRRDQQLSVAPPIVDWSEVSRGGEQPPADEKATAGSAGSAPA